MRMKIFNGLTLTLAAGAMFALTASTPVFAKDDSGAKSIVVGSDTTFPPFESQENGKPVGFDIDLIKAIAKDQNLDPSFKSMSFNGIIPSLQAGTLNAAVAGITITKDRMKNVDFSNAYYKSGLSLMVTKDSKIDGFDDLEGHVVATRKATSSVAYLHDHGIKDKYIKQYQNIDSAYQALVTGGADAVLFDNPVNLNFQIKHKDKVKIVGDLLTGEYYGIAISKKNPELVEKINAGLKAFKQSGDYEKLFDKYFDGDKRAMVKDAVKPDDIALGD